MKYDDLDEEEIAFLREQRRVYMREWRKNHKMTPEQRRKDACRSYAGVYKRRGLLTPQSCEVCGEPAEMHHEDYEQPLLVRWICKTHHRELHRSRQKRGSASK